MKEVVEEYLGSTGKKKSGDHPLFDVDAILSDEALLVGPGWPHVRKGMTVRPRVKIGELLRDPDWEVHENLSFSFNCETCDRLRPTGLTCQPPSYARLLPLAFALLFFNFLVWIFLTSFPFIFRSNESKGTSSIDIRGDEEG